MWKGVLFLIHFFALSSGDDLISIKPIPSETYKHSLSLDELENYYLFWKFDEEYITCEVHVRTGGWVGFGLSGSGGMAGADIVVGWVKNGKAEIHDLYALGQERPLVEEEQNYKLIFGKEELSYTILKFKRKLDTCDYEKDNIIEEGTLRLIFAWGEEDPVSISDLQYHGVSKRGVRSLTLLDYSVPDEDETPSYDQMPYFDLLPNNANISEDRTMYYCRIQALPAVTSKKHIVYVEPLIEKKNIAVVHHIVAYECHGYIQEEEVGRVCWENAMPDNATKCDTVLFAWAVGQKAFHYPKDVGYPFGDKNEARFIQIEMHYDNPEHISGIVDNSGLRFYYTEPRKYEAGTMMVGHSVWWPPLSIPPKTDLFTINSYCSKDCTRKGIPESGINIFASLLHTHQVGKSIHIKHIRDGNELPELSREDYYDFNYQQLRIPKQEKHLKPGDELMTTCTYSTKSRDKMTYGGPGTDNEMCVAFFLYYPRVDLQACMSTTQDYYPIYQWVMQKALTGELEIDINNKNKNAYDYLDDIKWTDEDRRQFQQKAELSHGYTEFCAFKNSGEGLFGGGNSYYKEKFTIKTPHHKDSKCPKKQTVTDSATSQTTALWILIVNIVICIKIMY